MTEKEARQILGVTEKTSWEEIVKVGVYHSFVSQLLSILLVCKCAWKLKHISGFASAMQKYDTLFEKNTKNGSFYPQSKVYRAKECLEAVQPDKGHSG